MRWRRAAVAALLALVCLAAGADASSASLLRGGRSIRVELQGSNGYSVLIVSHGKRYLVVTTKNEVFTTEYATRDALVSADRLKATLPGRGSIAVRFHPRGPAHRLPAFAGCDGPAPTLRRGVVRGAIEFAGERRYTQVEAREAPAEIEEWTKQRCRGGGNSEWPGRNLADWTSKLWANRLGVEFIVRKYRPGLLAGDDRVVFSVETAEAASEWAAMVVYRRVKVPSPASAFVDAHPERMTFSPPPPFTGTATFARTPESVFAWEGDLSVLFPGMDPLPLAGPEFELGYCRREVGCVRQRIPRWLEDY
jgi:hypothetical protein